MYHRGEEVPRDYLEAVKWYQRAAQHGHAFAQSNLGVMYAKGAGVPQDDVRAHMWFNIAASSGKVYAREIREDARKMRGHVEKNMSSAQITEAEQLARECMEKNYKGCY
jgi:TPR repeat protein